MARTGLLMTFLKKKDMFSAKCVQDRTRCLFSTGMGRIGTIRVKTTNKKTACFSEKITFRNAPSPQEFTEGDNADIICEVESSPPPTVLWKYKGRKIQMEKDGKIIILLLL